MVYVCVCVCVCVCHIPHGIPSVQRNVHALLSGGRVYMSSKVYTAHYMYHLVKQYPLNTIYGNVDMLGARLACYYYYKQLFSEEFASCANI